MIKSIHRDQLIIEHRLTNPLIPYQLFELNYCWRMQEIYNNVELLENGKRIMFFTNAKEYNDKRTHNKDWIQDEDI